MFVKTSVYARTKARIVVITALIKLTFVLFQNARGSLLLEKTFAKLDKEKAAPAPLPVVKAFLKRTIPG